MYSNVKIFGWRESKYTPGHFLVDVKLYDMITTKDIFWSPTKNSYVMAENKKDPTKLFLLVIDNMGGVRWEITKFQISIAEEHENDDIANEGDKEVLMAARHFGLILERSK